METILTMANYLLRILPGLALIALFFIFIKPNSNLRIIIYIFSFVLMRDAMTPLGLWSLGAANGMLWIRLGGNPAFLVLFGISSLGIVTALYFLDKENRKYLTWFKNGRFSGALTGTAVGLLVVLPYVIISRGIDINLRGGPVDSALLIPLLIFALLGNFFEEGLFRGYVLGFLKNTRNDITAGVCSGLVFALCHIFLALTVTGIGVPLLVFTLWEGILAGLVGARYGIVPATITHGGAIFLLSSGLI